MAQVLPTAKLAWHKTHQTYGLVAHEPTNYEKNKTSLSSTSQIIPSKSDFQHSPLAIV